MRTFLEEGASACLLGLQSASFACLAGSLGRDMFRKLSGKDVCHSAAQVAGYPVAVFLAVNSFVTYNLPLETVSEINSGDYSLEAERKLDLFLNRFNMNVGRVLVGVTTLVTFAATQFFKSKLPLGASFIFLGIGAAGSIGSTQFQKMLWEDRSERGEID